MIVKREVSVKAYTTDNILMVEGCKYAFEITEGKCLVGIYEGMTTKGALKFASIISDFLVHFNVMPASILSIYKVDVKVLGKDEK